MAITIVGDNEISSSLIPTFSGMEARAKHFAYGENYQHDEKNRKHDSFALDKMEELLSKLLTKASEDPALKEDPNVKAMIASREEIAKLNEQTDLTEAAKKAAITAEEEKFSKAAEALNKSNNAKIFANIANQITPDFNSAVRDAAADFKDPLEKFDRAAFNEEFRKEWDEIKGNPKLIALNRERRELNIDYLDSKNGGWSEDTGFNHYRNSDQIPAEDKKELAGKVIKIKEKWDEMREEFGGKLPDAYQQKYDKDAAMYKGAGFGEEFASGKLKESYPEATKATGSESSLNMAKGITAITNGLPSVAQNNKHER